MEHGGTVKNTILILRSYFIVLCCAFCFEVVLFNNQKFAVALPMSRLFLRIDFSLLSSDHICICVCVNMFLRIRSMIARDRLRLGLGGGADKITIRYVRQGG